MYVITLLVAIYLSQIGPQSETKLSEHVIKLVITQIQLGSTVVYFVRDIFQYDVTYLCKNEISFHVYRYTAAMKINDP